MRFRPRVAHVLLQTQSIELTNRRFRLEIQMTTKNLSLARFIALGFATFLFTPNANAFAQNAAAQTKAEIERLQQSLKENPIQSTDLADLTKGIDRKSVV